MTITDEKDKPRLSEKKGGKDDDSNKARKVIERVNSQTRFLGLASTFLDFLKDKVSDEVYGKVIKALEELEREGYVANMYSESCRCGRRNDFFIVLFVE